MTTNPTEAEIEAADVVRLMPSYGAVSWDALRASINEAAGCDVCQSLDDPSVYTGHQMVPLFNMNSLNRIVSAFLAAAKVRPEGAKPSDATDVRLTGAQYVALHRRVEREASRAHAAEARAERAEAEIVRWKKDNEAAWTQANLMETERDAARAQAEALAGALREADGCFDAALIEGWLNVLRDGDIARIRDLWNRRISYALHPVKSALVAYEAAGHPGKNAGGE